MDQNGVSVCEGVAVRGADSARDTKRFAAWLFMAVFGSRALTSSSAYFADANRHLTAIHNQTYVIQPPGYWLFNRTAGLFPDPEIAISVMNWCFSAAGAVVFYLAARRLTDESVARASSIVYGSVFFAWFSGNVHSTYASQLFFPVVVFWCFLHYWEERNFRWILAAAILFAVGSGFRPPDGAFFAPAFLYGLSKSKHTHILVSLGVVFILCLIWLIPQQLSLYQQTIPVESNSIMSKHHNPSEWDASFSSHFGSLAEGVLVTGFSKYALSNVIRFIIPFVLALFPLLDMIFQNRKQAFLWIWTLPGMAFYLLIFFPEGPYLGYMLAALILLAVTDRSTHDKKKIWLLATCAACNVIFYFGWRPTKLSNHTLQLAEYVIDANAGKHTYYAVQHHYVPTLRELLHVPGYDETISEANCSGSGSACHH